MGKFIKGDVVVVPFPFSDLSQSKKRPALVLADLDGDDLILSQITSQSVYDSHSVKILENDFDDGIILYKTGHINEAKIKEVTTKIISIFTKG